MLGVAPTKDTKDTKRTKEKKKVKKRKEKKFEVETKLATNVMTGAIV